jgi:serine/threonine protein kinase
MATEWQPSEVIKISDDLKISFWLRKDKDKIILDKLGDGTYSSVYRGRIETGLPADVAIKLLYDNNAIRPRQISDLNQAELDALIDPLAKRHGKDPTKIKEAIVRHRNSGYKLWKKLEEAYKLSGETKSGSDDHDFDSFMDDVRVLVSSSAVYRFREERFVTRTLMESSRLRFGVGFDDTKGVVRVLDGTDTFLSALESCGDLKSYFYEIEPIKVSNYALVMDLYSFSLKDLLERPVIREDNRTGYEILKTLTHKQRIREALIILKGAADGLEKLHNVQRSKDRFDSLFHRDIKPGNIFIKRMSTEEFEVALGDLGNLPYMDGSYPSAESDNTLSRPPDYAPGTQNYRSPEQKYYMDVADVQVEILPEKDIENRVRQILSDTTSSVGSASDNDDTMTIANTAEPMNGDDDNAPSRLENTGDDGQRPSNSVPDEGSSEPAECVVLLVRDPKFKNTLIEEDDYIIFSKDNERRHHPIHQYVPLSKDRRNNESGYCGFVLDVDPKLTNIKSDNKTQVEFYKTQSYRTDLFGIGAVMFDMLTVGASPEQFYESIRKYEGQSIDTIVNRYDTLTRGELEGDNPDFIEIFRPFRHHNDLLNPYPDKEIIEFILKCMLYQSEGTFYQENIKEPRQASKALSSRMEKLRVQHTRDYQNLSENESILIHRPKFLPPPGDVGQLIKFNQRIGELQGLMPWPVYEQLSTSLMVANRLMYGVYYCWRVVDLVRDVIQGGNQPNGEGMEHGIGQKQDADSLHLRQILPTSIWLQFDEGKSKPAQLALTALFIDLMTGLRENRLELLIRSGSNSFVPNEIASMRRDIRLLRSRDAGTRNDQRVTCKYRFRDSAIVSRDVSQGDWIVVGNQLWTIIDKLPGRNELEIEWSPDFGGEGYSAEDLFKDGSKPIDATYFSRIDPLKYYLEMLGLYLQQLVFTYSPITTTTRDRVDIRALLRAFEIGPRFRIYPLNLKPECELREIYERCVHMLTQLTLHEADDSYYDIIIRKKNSTSNGISQLDATMFNQIQRDAYNLYESVMKMLNITDCVPEDHPKLIKSPEGLPSGFDDMVDKLTHIPIDIEKIIKRSGLIEGEDLSGSE